MTLTELNSVSVTDSFLTGYGTQRTSQIQSFGGKNLSLKYGGRYR